MGRANPFRALVAGLTADKLLLLREAVDERRCSDEVGAGTLAGPRGLSAGPEVPGLRRPQRLEGRLRKLLPKGRELRFDRLAPADLALAMSHVDRRAGAVRLSLGSGAEGLAKHDPGPVETHPHRSFNWENNGPGPPRTVQGRSARCGNTLSVQSARWG